MSKGNGMLAALNVGVFIAGLFMTTYQTKKIIRNIWGEDLIVFLLGLILSQWQTMSIKNDVKFLKEKMKGIY